MTSHEELAFYPTGQVVGMTNDERDCRAIVFEMINDYIEAVERLNSTLEEE